MLNILLKVLAKILLENKTEENPESILSRVFVVICVMMTLCLGSFFLSVSLIFDLLIKFIVHFSFFIKENYFPDYSETLIEVVLKLMLILIFAINSYALFKKCSKYLSAIPKLKNFRISSFNMICKAFLEGWNSQ